MLTEKRRFPVENQQVKTQGNSRLGGILLVSVGIGVAFMGLVFFLAQYFDDWRQVVQLLVSFGIGIPFVVLGTVSERTKPGNSNVTLWFAFGIPALIYGLDLLAEMIWGRHGPVGLMLLYALDAAVCLFLYWLTQRNVALFFAFLVGSLLFYQTGDVAVEKIAFLQNWVVGEGHSMEWLASQAIVLGMIWALSAWSFSKTAREPLVNFLYLVGSVLVLSGIHTLAWLGGNIGNFWQVVDILTAGLLIAGSAFLGRKVLLWVGGFGLVSGILQVTYIHFEKSFTWSVALMISGLVIAAVGYLVLRMHAQYFQPKKG